MDDHATPVKIIWSKQAFTEFQNLPVNIQELIERKLPLLRFNPQMYQVESAGYWAGLRRAVVGNFKLYHTYWHAENAIYIETIVSIHREDLDPH